MNKYQIARQFREGACQGLKGGAIDPNSEEAWIEGYEWATKYIKPQLNDVVNKYVTDMGFAPFDSIEALR